MSNGGHNGLPFDATPEFYEQLINRNCRQLGLTRREVNRILQSMDMIMNGYYTPQERRAMDDRNLEHTESLQFRHFFQQMFTSSEGTYISPVTFRQRSSGYHPTSEEVRSRISNPERRHIIPNEILHQAYVSFPNSHGTQRRGLLNFSYSPDNIIMGTSTGNNIDSNEERVARTNMDGVRSLGRVSRYLMMMAALTRMIRNSSAYGGMEACCRVLFLIMAQSSVYYSLGFSNTVLSLDSLYVQLWARHDPGRILLRTVEELSVQNPQLLLLWYCRPPSFKCHRRDDDERDEEDTPTYSDRVTRNIMKRLEIKAKKRAGERKSKEKEMKAQKVRLIMGGVVLLLCAIIVVAVIASTAGTTASIAGAGALAAKKASFASMTTCCTLFL